MTENPLPDVQALLFDVFGTVVDWHGSVTAELGELGKTHGVDGDWSSFAQTWRKGYLDTTRQVAQGGVGPASVDEMHRQILETILSEPEWDGLAAKLDGSGRDQLNLAWHRLHGWPDSTPGLYALKKRFILATLSNGNVRLLADMAKFADLPWDVVFSAELFSSFKPNPKVYLGAAHHLSLAPRQCAMVAAHIYDLRAAAALGMRTVYIRRPGEESAEVGQVKSKAEGGDVDVVVDSFMELAKLCANNTI
ncbi:Haloacid type II [Mycena indigotica]|uniref:Haloacid type II n=1 Tax=Mycena indigotica TaxID=2126181 RepID=A0A8H6SR50_9AGAR|nr:Haloacid type II [Mycena indigotica]KAF7303966.1 Haloacid type II [Mycena indigotica]